MAEATRNTSENDFRRDFAGEVLLMLATNLGQQGHDLLATDAKRIAKKAVEYTDALLGALGEGR